MLGRLPSRVGITTARQHDFDLPSQVVECVQRRVRVRISNGELRLTTYGRKSSMPIFSPNRCKRRRFVFTDL